MKQESLSGLVNIPLPLFLLFHSPNMAMISRNNSSGWGGRGGLLGPQVTEGLKIAQLGLGCGDGEGVGTVQP